LVCERCKRDARFVEHRAKTYTSLVGHIRLNRSYYHCRACGRGHMPWVKELGLTENSLTPAAAEITSIAGVQTSFGKASEITLRKLSGLRLSESTVERTTEATGERIARLREQRVQFGEPTKWKWQRDAHGRKCGYVSLDATGVRQQGPGGARAEGRMAYVGMIYNPNSEHDNDRPPPHQVRYLAGFYELDTLGAQLRCQAEHVGWKDVEEQIALTDGGAGLEEMLARFFPRATCILDFWHAKEHLVELAASLWPEDESQRKAWLDEQCPRLKHEGGATVLAVLEAIDVSRRTAAVQEAHRQHTGYFRNNVHRMDYPTYIANGWQIGSGPVESACGTVIGDRLKGSGMRWSEPGSNAVCHARALFNSEPCQWEAFWKVHPN
jgi:hypothetical protein